MVVKPLVVTLDRMEQPVTPAVPAIEELAWALEDATAAAEPVVQVASTEQESVVPADQDLARAHVLHLASPHPLARMGQTPLQEQVAEARSALPEYLLAKRQTAVVPAWEHSASFLNH